METTTFRYDCTGDAPHIIKQEVHFIGNNYFFVSKVNRPEDGEPEMFEGFHPDSKTRLTVIFAPIAVAVIFILWGVQVVHDEHQHA